MTCSRKFIQGERWVTLYSKFLCKFSKNLYKLFCLRKMSDRMKKFSSLENTRKNGLTPKHVKKKKQHDTTVCLELQQKSLQKKMYNIQDTLLNATKFLMRQNDLY